jgi:serpin B
MKKLTILMLCALASCKNEINESVKKPMDKTMALKNYQDAANSNNLFAADLVQFYANQNSENIFFSPFSVLSALSMTQEGAAETTQTEMQKVLRLNANNTDRQKSFWALNSLLSNKNNGYKLSIANALWIEKTIALDNNFVQTTNQNYFAAAFNVDYKNNPEPARKTINQWVDDKTNHKIKDLIPDGMINSKTKLVLTNAIYFKAPWAENLFNKDFTTDENFTTANGTTTKVPMMQTGGSQLYFEDKKVQILALPYHKNELEMVIVLPKKGETIATITKEATAINGYLQQKLDLNLTQVWFPKFKFETKYFMSTDLQKMGMNLAFSDQANFSGISKTNPLKIGQVIHQTFIEVDETGTEAAAATAVIMADTSAAPIETPIPKIFKADHPFIFAIRHKATGTLLFVGIIKNIK